MKIGIFSGTFDPVHAGHIAFCRQALANGLDRVLLLPEAAPRNKRRVSSFEHRVAMLSLATHDEQNLDVELLESPQFSVSETLPELVRRFPDDDLTLLIGSDVVHTFAYRWPGLEELLDKMTLYIGIRGQDTYEEVKECLSSVQAALGVSARYTILPATSNSYADVASSQIRADARSLSRVLPSVAAYIHEHKLYDQLAQEGLS